MTVRTTLLNKSFKVKLNQNEQAVPPRVPKETDLYQSKTPVFWPLIPLIFFN